MKVFEWVIVLLGVLATAAMLYGAIERTEWLLILIADELLVFIFKE